jgi:dsDNA-specific endonuclease/ATPase MutS2
MATKEEYIEKLKTQLDSWQSQMGDLEVKASAATEDLRAELEEQMGSLRVKFREGESKLDQLADVSEEKWEDLKEDAEKIFDDLIVDFKEDIEYAKAEAEGLVTKIKSFFS